MLADYCKTIPWNNFHAYYYSLDATEDIQQKAVHQLAITPSKWSRRINLTRDKFDSLLMSDED